MPKKNDSGKAKTEDLHYIFDTGEVYSVEHRWDATVVGKREHECSGLCPFNIIEEPLEFLLRLSGELSSWGLDIQDHGKDYVQSWMEVYEEDKSEGGKRAFYGHVTDSIYEDITELQYEAVDLLMAIYGHLNLLALPTEASPVILEALGVFQLFVDKLSEVYDEFIDDLRYSMFEDCLDEMSQIYGKRILARFKKEAVLKLKEYENAFSEIACFTEYVEEHQIAFRLGELAARLKAFCISKGGGLALPKLTRGGAQEKKAVTLLQFMQRYCEKQKLVVLRYRRKSFNDAHNRKTITLPEHVGQWKSGRAKYYNVGDLKEKWPTYRDVLPNLPPLK
ncbi:MAG: hypothetical protein ACYS83_05090 [Planctomycetota bacterium]